jgi:hypothetical protein
LESRLCIASATRASPRWFNQRKRRWLSASVSAKSRISCLAKPCQCSERLRLSAQQAIRFLTLSGEAKKNTFLMGRLMGFFTARSYLTGTSDFNFISARNIRQPSSPVKLRSRWPLWAGIAVRLGGSADFPGLFSASQCLAADTCPLDVAPTPYLPLSGLLPKSAGEIIRNSYIVSQFLVELCRTA